MGCWAWLLSGPLAPAAGERVRGTAVCYGFLLGGDCCGTNFGASSSFGFFLGAIVLDGEDGDTTLGGTVKLGAYDAGWPAGTGAYVAAGVGDELYAGG